MGNELIFELIWIIFIIIIVLVTSSKQKQRTSQEKEPFETTLSKEKQKISTLTKEKSTILKKETPVMPKQIFITDLSTSKEKTKKVFELKTEKIQEGFIISVILGEPKAYRFLKKFF